MKILFFIMPSQPQNYPVIPLGVLYIVNSLQKDHHECKIIDLNFFSNTDTFIIKEITNFNPDLIGISIRNIAETTNMNNIYKDIHSLVKLVQRYAKVVLGGAGFSIFPQKIMEITGADYGIVGVGEKAIKHIINNLGDKQFGNIVIMDDDNFITSDISLTFNEYWNKYGKYFIFSNAAVPIQTIRGCELRCRYCTYPSLTNYCVQKRPVDLIINEIKNIIVLTNRRSFYFVDSVFNMDLHHTKLLLEAIIKQKLDINFSCCINPQNFDEEMVYMIQAAGCNYCEIGIDSFSDKNLKKLNKRFNSEQAIKLIKQVEEKNIPYSISLILGGYGETEETLMETIHIADGFLKANINAFIGERIYPNTSLAKELNKNDEDILYMANKESIYLNESLIPLLKFMIKKLEGKKWTFINKCYLEEYS